MAFDIALLILFIALFSLILFREEITSFFKERAETDLEKKEAADETFPFTKPENRQDKRTAPPEEKPVQKTETPLERRREAEEQRAREERQLREKEALEAEKRKRKERAEAARKAAAEPKPTPRQRTKPPTEPELSPVAKPAPKPQAIEKTVPKPAPKPKIPKAAPEKTYPDFDNSRLLSMGLSQEDADSFVLELIGQIDDHIPQIEAAIEADDFENVERLTHSLKGSATNLGTGGVADQLIEFNTYCKSEKEKEALKSYLSSLKAYLEKLKKQFT